MFKALEKKMLITVKGVDTKTDARALMRMIVERNCKVDPRIIDSMIELKGTYGEGKHETYEYQLVLENYDFRGIVQDFKLLKTAGVIESVTKSPCWIVY